MAGGCPRAINSSMTFSLSAGTSLRLGQNAGTAGTNTITCGEARYKEMIVD